MSEEMVRKTVKGRTLDVTPEGRYSSFKFIHSDREA